jgi:hypothetical protein
MSRLLRLHQYADAAESCESLTPLIFIKDKYAQDCWLKASLQSIPESMALTANSTASAVQRAGQHAQVAGSTCGAQPMEH